MSKESMGLRDRLEKTKTMEKEMKGKTMGLVNFKNNAETNQQTSVVSVTPKIAQMYLLKNSKNRKIRKSVVSSFVGIIKRGEWKLTHQGIAISEDGFLLDGQHRLHAVIESGTPVLMNVSTGVDSSTFEAIDGGIKRTIGDRLLCSNNEAQVYCSLGRLLYVGMTGACTVDMIKSIREKVGELTNELIEYAPTITKYFSSSGCKAAAVLRMAEGNYKNKDYVMIFYRYLTLSNFTEMPKIGHAINRQVLHGTADSGNLFDSMARMWVVFDSERSDLEKVQIGDIPRLLNEMRDSYFKSFGRESWMVKGTKG